jgi:flagellar protein FliO/FliZ
MNSLFGLGLPQPYVYVLALAGILALLAVFAYFLRRIVQSTRGFDGSGRGRQPRLGIVDTFSVDRQRQLMIVRRDSVEHLILVGGNSDLVIETNITRTIATPQRDVSTSLRATPTLAASTAVTAESPSANGPLPKVPNPPLSFAPRPPLRTRSDENEIRPSDFAEIARHFEKPAEPREPEASHPDVSVFPSQKLGGYTSPFVSPLTASHEALTPRADEPDQLPQSSESDPLSAPIIPLRDEISPTEGLRRLLGRNRDTP